MQLLARASTNQIRDLKQPSFKPSLLGSPFYPGRTMYGGAASSYINQPNIKQETVAVVNESPINDDTAISSSARRIMDLLESYSSPLTEARRIPLYTKPKNDGFNISSAPSSSTNNHLGKSKWNIISNFTSSFCNFYHLSQSYLVYILLRILHIM